MSFAARIQREVPLVPGEAPHDYMLRYLLTSPVATGVTLEKWIRGVVFAAQQVGHPELTPLVADGFEQFRLIGHGMVANTINEYRAPNTASQIGLKDTHIYMAVCLSQMQGCLERLREEAPEFVHDLPDIEAESTATMLGDDLLTALKRYDQLNAERYKGR